MNERINELFANCFDNLDTWAKVAVHNHYVVEGDGYGDEILENTEDEIDMAFNSPYEALQAMGEDYHINDDYMWVDDLGNLCSSDSEDDMPLADMDEMAEYYFTNPSFLKEFKEFNEWYDAVEYGLDDEEEEDTED